MLYVRECQIFEVERAQAWQRHQLIFTSFLNMCLVIPHLSDLLDLGDVKPIQFDHYNSIFLFNMKNNLFSDTNKSVSMPCKRCINKWGCFGES